MQPRYYQQDAHDAVVEHWKKSLEPCLVEIATGGGKALCVSMLAKTLHSLSKGKRVLCLAPSKELVEQNAAKYLLLGEQCSIYSASIGKSLRHKVIFATEGTFKAVAKSMGDQFAGVIIDESHKVTTTVKTIIDDMKQGNPNLRICGLTATPYRLGTGYIYEIDQNNHIMPPEKAREPYYKKLVYRIGADELIEQGYLTPIMVGNPNAKSYDTSSLKLQSNNKFKQSDIDKTFVGLGRETSDIVADVVAQSYDRRGVMFFAATVAHAKEILASLPPEYSRMIGGDVNMAKREREALVSDFKEQRFKYLVNVATMTTGVDFTHVDVIAMLRRTESASLFQQIIGRALRLHDGKTEALLLDYADNVEVFAPDGDIFNPTIDARTPSESAEVEVTCPQCGGRNEFAMRHNPEQYDASPDGYFIDANGSKILSDENKPIPSHHGRRCQNVHPRTFERCDYYWSYKECEECEHKNDIAARYCSECKHELVNPNDNLKVENTVAVNPIITSTEAVLSMRCVEFISKKGNRTLRADFVTEQRAFSAYIMLEPPEQWRKMQRDKFMRTTVNGTIPPDTVTYRKKDGYYTIMGMNNEVTKVD